MKWFMSKFEKEAADGTVSQKREQDSYISYPTFTSFFYIRDTHCLYIHLKLRLPSLHLLWFRRIINANSILEVGIVYVDGQERYQWATCQVLQLSPLSIISFNFVCVPNFEDVPSSYHIISYHIISYHVVSESYHYLFKSHHIISNITSHNIRMISFNH